MATTITLLCLVHGDPSGHSFAVDISNDKLVSHLKQEIKKEKENYFRNIDSDKLTLWKVDIPYNEDVVELLVLEETDTVKKMSPVSEIGEYFENAPTKKHIHVVIERPPGK